MNKAGIINNKSSAERIVPIIMDIINPKSVADFGCAIGVWLDNFKNTGKVEKVLGIDGKWVNKKDLLINKSEFFQFNLENDITPFIHDKFDLVICLEVAEHISKNCENLLLKNLTSLGDIILFSAAIPNQGGDHHVNEQKQSYWINKFNRRGYIHIDCIRPRIWDDDNIMYCYRQNMFIFVKEDQIDNYIRLKAEKDKGVNNIKDIIHPKAFDDCINNHKSLGYLISMQKKLLKAFKYKIINSLLRILLK
jgi:SAM-dependent methyltransferase